MRVSALRCRRCMKCMTKASRMPLCTGSLCSCKHNTLVLTTTKTHSARDEAQLLEHLARCWCGSVWFLGAARDSSPIVHLQCIFPYVVAFVGVNISAHIKNLRHVGSHTVVWTHENTAHITTTIKYVMWLTMVREINIVTYDMHCVSWKMGILPPSSSY